jgi:hypothetical protein
MAVGIFGLILVRFTGQCYGELEVGFYKRKCLAADVEKTVADVVKAMFFKDPTIAATLLRMKFHDGFVKVTSLISIFFLFLSIFRSMFIDP